MLANITSIASQDQISEFISDYIADWPREPPRQSFPYFDPGHWAGQPMAYQVAPQELAENLTTSARFRALQLGTWLNRPDVALITAAVEAVTPSPYSQDIALLVEALKLAADAQRREGQRQALLTTGLISVIGVLAVASRN